MSKITSNPLNKEKKLQVDLLWDFWRSVPVGVWSASDTMSRLSRWWCERSIFECYWLGNSFSPGFEDSL